MKRAEPPDGGWGWLVVLAGFLANSLTFGVLRSLGVLFEDLVEAFEATTAQVSWVTAIALATEQFASPLGTAASTRYGARPVVMLGSLFSSLGIFGASFSTTLLQLYLTLGFLTGLGWALAFAPTMGTLSRYFSSRRSLAMGLALTGNGLASFALSPLLRLLADSLAWRGALLVTSAFSLHLLLCGALLRPLALRGDQPKLSAPFDLGLFAQRGFGAFALGTALLAAGYFTPYVHLDAYSRALGVGPYRAALVVSLAALADALARLLAGCLADRHVLPPVYLLVLFNSFVGGTLLFLPATSSYGSLLTLALLYGLSAGSFATVAFAVLPELVGVARVVNATGLCLMSMSVGGLLGPPLSGLLRDQTGDFTASFLVGGAFVLCASLVFLALPSPLGSCCSAQPDEMPGAKGQQKPPCPLPAAPCARGHLEI
ncbi:monocarboxylate transporter 11 isoform X2 [Python bivittatus]|uniref:Monocarboxylate transporter 11 isoform X2 n=1 Tax=Python bivittatus TaxID=176946 RepID=A0A9F2RD99_PYTBI|nr:monocarboxylate transporter 11 isoform X2 [Python bivittatus]